MSKLFRSMALMMSLALVSAGTVSLAQEKGKAKGDEPKKTDKGGSKADKADKVGTIEYYKTDSGKWRFMVKNEDGKSFVMPMPTTNFETKEDCLKMIEFLKKTLNEAKPAERKEDAKKK